MKKLIAIFLVLLSLPTMAADVELRVAAGSFGRVDDTTLDVGAMANGSPIIELELVLTNLDFTLAGLEGNFLFPTWLTLVDVSAVGTANPPFTTDLAAAQKLPSDAQGNDTSATFRNDEGVARIGIVITDPAQRPDSGDMVLATFRLILGEDFYGSANCISASEVISFLACTTGSAECPIFANDGAVAQNITYGNTEIALNNSSTTFVKGDYNSDGSLTTLDVGGAIQCNVFGYDQASCPLMGVTSPELEIKADVNCDDDLTTLEIGPLIRRAIGINNRPTANKRMNYLNLDDNNGVISLPGEDNAATVVTVDLKIDGKVRFNEKIELSKEAIADGWQVFTNMLNRTNTFRYMLVNMTGENSVIPNVDVRYDVLEKGSRVAISNIESYAANSKAVSHEPELLNREDLRRDIDR